jgi:hypothetical protein
MLAFLAFSHIPPGESGFRGFKDEQDWGVGG